MADNHAEIQTIHIVAEADGDRLDRFLASRLSSLSRTEIQRLIREGKIQVNNSSVKPSYNVVSDDSILVEVPSPRPTQIAPENIPLDVLYEDDDLVAINKPSGMVVHPAAGNSTGTLLNGALCRWPDMKIAGSPDRPAIVHRLDKDTSGVILLAKTTAALRSLQEQFKARTVYKRYLALVDGIPSSSEGIITAPIGRDPKQRKRMAVIRGGRAARTIFQILEVFPSHALLSIRLETGRTHQIRVHMAWLGFPVAGDRIYGHRKATISASRFFLHATELQVDSPTSGDRLVFHVPLPDQLEEILSRLRHDMKLT